MFRPDILLIDEVLSVGDAAFQEKCLQRIEDFRASGTTILLVSHIYNDIARHCDRALWLDQGRVAALGQTQEVLDRYTEALALDQT